MFFAHLPAGYLISRAFIRARPDANPRWIMAAGMAGGVFPDVDLLYLHLLDATPQHHHTYWTHLPIAWLLVSIIALAASRERRAKIRLPLAAFLIAWFSHLLLDSITGHMWWLYPLVDKPYSLLEIEARVQPWWMNFLLHWSILMELVIIAAAIRLEARSPLLFKTLRLPKASVAAGLMLAGLVLAETYLPVPLLQQPVLGATARDWNLDAFWHPNWGRSGVHKGIDIFAEQGTPVMAAQDGLVLYRGKLKQGGNVLLVASPKGWLHYYAHLQSATPGPGAWVVTGEPIGFVGNSGNAAGKPPHLHYAIFSPIPRLTGYRPVQQGWKRVFYRDPGQLIRSTASS